MKKDYTLQKVMETQKDLKDTDRFDWLESTELAIDKRKFLLNRLFVEQPIQQDEDQGRVHTLHFCRVECNWYNSYWDDLLDYLLFELHSTRQKCNVWTGPKATVFFLNKNVFQTDI